ncbi:uncharacterized protein LOC143563953 [Bidens hawaiensis]|uniref:uncharacterized protein LOC143563953 n=1 Tax=Bidens hawaiensis TaxID=980011 RepID=UPI00404A9CD5
MLKNIDPLDRSVISKGVSDAAKDSMKQTISTMLGLLPSDQLTVMVRVSKRPLQRLLSSSFITGLLRQVFCGSTAHNYASLKLHGVGKNLVVKAVNSENDVIGIIQDDKFRDIIKKNGVLAKLLDIDLYGSNGNKIGITLWNSYATQILSYIEQNPQEAAMVVFYALLYTNLFMVSKPCISNANGVAKLILNQEIPEIVDFKNSLVQMLASEPSSSALLSPPTIRDSFLAEFVNDTEFSHNGEVENIRTTKKVVVCGTIMPASNYSRWYYIGCKVCATTLNTENKVSHEDEIDGETSLNQFKGTYKCGSQKCNNAIVDAVARYRVPFDVQDSTGSLSLTLWEGQAFPMFKITTMDLFKRLVEEPTLDSSNEDSVGHPDINLSDKDSVIIEDDDVTPLERKTSKASAVN